MPGSAHSDDPAVVGSARRLLRARRLFDGVDFETVPSVVVHGERIEAVGSAAESLADGDPAVEVVELGDVSLLPGLVDCHQHLVFDGVGTLERQVEGRTDDELVERARGHAAHALRGGVTTIRDLGDRGFVTLALRDDPTLPTLLCSGPPITPVGGHCWFLGGECSDRSSMVEAVRRRIDSGCDVVKIMATGGAMTPTTPMWKSQFGLDDLRKVVAIAHEAGLAVAAHCHGLDGIADSVAAGVDTIEHCTFMNESMQVAPNPALVRDLAESTTVISATIGSEPGVERSRLSLELAPRVRAALASVYELGGRVVVGTDAGITPYKPHDVARHAVHDLLEIGMSATEALRAMTRGGADALGLATKGRLAEGADADLVAVRGDLRSDPTVVVDVAEVWRTGRSVVGGLERPT